MGATGGHMLHPYENLDLTFGQLRDIYQIASKGFPNIKITEKTDGQNISISYDHRTSEALAIRNTSHAREGGRNKDDLKAYFTTDRIAAGKNPTPDNVVNAFYTAMINFEKIAHLLSPEFFYTPTGERLFYNAEVMDPVSENVIPYDTQVLLIHRVGHKKLVDGKLISLSDDQADYRGAKKLAEERSAALEARLQELQIDSPDIPTTKINAIVDFTEFIEKKEAYRDAANELRAIQGSAKTIGEYLENRLKTLLQEKLGSGYSEETYDQLVVALLHFATTGMPRKTKEIKWVLETIPGEETKDFINEFLRTRSAMKDIKDRAMNPLIMVNHRFATRVLEGFISGYTLQAEDSLSRLRTKVGKKAKDPKVLADKSSLALLKTSLAKIHGGEDVGDVLSDEAVQSALEKITTVIEGLVFDYEGETYKFTGQFAPVNQMLGLGKYDRAPKKSISEVMEPRFNKRVIVVYPGRFQPMGRHHAEVFKRIQDVHGVENSFIATSDVVKPPKSPFNFAEKQKIAVAHGIQPSSIVRVKNPYYAREITDNYDPDTTSVVYLVGAKDMEENPRFTKTEGTTKEGFDWAIDVAPHVSIDISGVGEMSGTSLRKALKDASLERFEEILGFSDFEIFDLVKSRLSGIQEQKKTFILLYSLVEQILDEKKEKTKVSKPGQKRVSKKIAHLIGDEGKSKEQAAAIAYSMEDEGDLEEVSACGGAVGGIEGYAGPGNRKGRKKKKKQDTLIREVLNYLEKSGIMEIQQ